MAGAVLRRVDITLLRDKSITDNTQIPLAGGRIDFYRQGATASASATIPSDGTPTPASVFDTGELAANDRVQVGVGGRTLTVAQVVNPTQVKLKTTVAPAVTVNSGTRLILLSRRPVLYSDPFGGTAVANSNYLLAGSNGRATAYIDQRRYDYVSGSQVALDATTPASMSGAVPTMSWQHTASGSDRLVIVGVSWREVTTTELLTGINYGVTPMTLLASGNYLDVYYLVNPPSGRCAKISWNLKRLQPLWCDGFGNNVIHLRRRSRDGQCPTFDPKRQQVEATGKSRGLDSR